MPTTHALLAAGGTLLHPGNQSSFSDIAYDSRLTHPGSIFVALRTARNDGHNYISEAIAAGATGIICRHNPLAPESHPHLTIIQSDDPLALVQQWAVQHLQHVAPHTIGVTGSVGKTTTRHAITCLLAQHAPTFGTRQSFNSLLGVPVALAHLRPEHRYAVLEYGTGAPGEIRQLTRLFPPRLAVVTAVGGAHLDTFDSLAAIAREKRALVAALPADGWAILNGDDSYVNAMAPHTAARVLRYGLHPSCDLWADGIEYHADYTRLHLHWHGHADIAAAPGSVVAQVPLLGEPAVRVALAAVATALVCGVPFVQAAAHLAHVARLPGRLNLLPATNGAMLLDDSFNAAVPSVRAALHTLAHLPARRRIAVLGALSDLGSHAPAAYAELGTLAGEVADVVIAKGDALEPLLRAARATPHPPRTVLVHTATDALHALPRDLGAGDLVLVKGAIAARMEQVAAGLLHAPPDVAPTAVLVRQAPGWARVRISSPGRPTWISLDLNALAGNIRTLRRIAGVPLMVTLKADGYGHGAVRVARTALANGAAALAVATLGEARVLREADITAPILVLGYTPPWQAHEAVTLGVTCTVFDSDCAAALAAAARTLQRQAAVHVKVDTGMGRLGVRPPYAGEPDTAVTDPSGVVAFLRALRGMAGLYVEGLYTHFATADSDDETYARLQLERFTTLLAAVTDAGLRPPLVHAGNSAATLRFPAARFDLVRPGIVCYGLSPAPAMPLPDGIAPVLSFYSEVAQVKDLPAGTPISYGGTYVTPQPARIATVPVGYADGVRRSPPWRCMLVRGQRAPIVGRVCMDYVMLDVTHIAGVQRGDTVVVLGTQGNERITADEVAGWYATINYEIVATLLPRVPREVP